MTALIGIDWGTSSLRAALMDERGEVEDEVFMPRGILTIPADGFAQVLQEVTARWPQHDPALRVACGMVGSRQGWLEAPYCACPAGFDDLARQLAWVEAGRIAIVPGMSCERQGVPDVMRGEETQVFGALALLGLRSALLVLPGTHSKWVRVVDGRIQGFTTFMTGEFYALLRQHSILARTLPQAEAELDEDAFAQGVRHALVMRSLLHTAFSVRTLSLFSRLREEAAASYLSGLVIGEELRAQELAATAQPVIVVGADALTRRYSLALGLLGVPAHAVGSQATWRGLWAITQALEKDA